MQLFKHQQEFLETNADKSALVWSCGTGKSRTAIEWSKGAPVLIICPKALQTNWKREADKWRGDRTSHYDVRVMSKEHFRRDHLTLPHFPQVIVDEVHNGFLTPHFKSQMSKALRNYLHRQEVKRVLLLSATVYTSSPWNIYNLATLLGHKIEWVKFNWMFFDQIKMGRRTIPVPKKGCEVKLAQLTKEIASVVDIYDCMDVPLQLHTEPELFSLTSSQKNGIANTYDPVPIVRFTHQHEIENGILLGNEFEALKTYECDKVERIKDLCEENPKIAIVCRYNAQIDQLAKVLEKHAPTIIRGDVKDRDAVCLSAENAERAVVLIQADCSLGYQLPSFPVCVFASQSYSYVNWEQICGRFLRMDKPSRTTFLYLLTAGDSIDQAVYNAIKRKEDFKINLYEKRSSLQHDIQPLAQVQVEEDRSV